MTMQLQLAFPDVVTARSALTLNKAGLPAARSRVVAAHFGKRHHNLLRDIAKLIAAFPGDPFIEICFDFNGYVDRRRRTLPEYLISWDGFLLLGGTFTGGDARVWKLNYSKAFAAYRADLQAHLDALVSALDIVRPMLRPVLEATKRGLSRTEIAAQLGKSVGSISYHRGVLRRLSLLPPTGRQGAVAEAKA
jgi:Rha family phage regulatory protein